MQVLLNKKLLSLSCVLTASIPLLNHHVLSNSTPFFHLDEFHCHGNESLLSDCQLGGIGVCMIVQKF